MGRAFANEKGLSEHADLFAKGAVLAQDPLNFETLDFLDEEELRVLRREVTHKVSSSLFLGPRVCLRKLEDGGSGGRLAETESREEQSVACVKG